MKYGVILARFQPVHNGHMELIKKACQENDKVLLLIGSANQINQRNPIPYSIRVEMLNGALIENDLQDKCVIKQLDDLTDESDNSTDWGFYLYCNIVDAINQSNFTVYYSDGFDIITSWFPKYVIKNFVGLSLLTRRTVENGISATQVRQYIMDENDELFKVVPSLVYNYRKVIKEFINIQK